MTNRYEYSPYELEKKHLRGDANYVGFVMLAMTVAMQTVFTGVVLLMCFCGMLTGAQLSMDMLGMDSTSYLFLYALVYTLAMGAPAIAVSLIARKRFFPLAPCRRVNAGDAFFGVLAAMGACMVANIVAGYIVAFFESFGAQDTPAPDYLEPNLQSFLLNLFVFAVLPALLEEMVFRGYVLRVLRPYGDWFAVAVSALLFGLMHGNLSQVPFALVVGFALGWLYIMTDNIWLPIAVHFANNAVSVLMNFLSFSLDESLHGKFYAVSIFLIAGLGLLGIGALFARRTALLRRLPRKTPLGVGVRIGSLLKAPAFVLSVVVFVILLVLECMP